jgi:MSHA biogenesis protein MshN
MSLINKMLQDLDARGGHGGAATLKPVPFADRRDTGKRKTVMVAIGVGTLVLAALAGAGVFYYRQSQLPKAPSVAILKAPEQPAVIAPAIKPAPLVEPVAAPAPVAAASTEKGEPIEKEELVADAPVQQEAPRQAAAPVARTDAAPAAPVVRGVAGGKKVAALPSAREMTPVQKAEAEYRRANLSLQEGRIREAIEALEAALVLEPKHEAARQTLVGLLVEAKRFDDAMRVLQAALTLDPRQPNLAMLLARLQIERGGAAIETLQRTLPHALGNGEYHAFLAGVLQREARHREAVEQYEAALQDNPQQGVWQMGLAISLLAEKRQPEALTAFKRARAGNNLSPELVTFVDRKIQQLSR